MPKLNIQIEKLIKTSLFLDNKRKEKLKDALTRASDADKRKLLKILKSEKKSISAVIKRYIKEKGKDAIDNLDMIIKKCKKLVRKTKEKVETKEDRKEMEKLLSSLDDSKKTKTK